MVLSGRVKRIFPHVFYLLGFWRVLWKCYRFGSNWGSLSSQSLSCDLAWSLKTVTPTQKAMCFEGNLKLDHTYYMSPLIHSYKRFVLNVLSRPIFKSFALHLSSLYRPGIFNLEKLNTWKVTNDWDRDGLETLPVDSTNILLIPTLYS